MAAPGEQRWVSARRVKDFIARALILALLWAVWTRVSCSSPAVAQDASSPWRTWSEWALAARADHVLAGLITDGNGVRVEPARTAEGVPQLPAADLV